MPDFDIIKDIEIKDSYRVNNVINSFDLDTTKLHEEFKGSIDLEGRHWDIGLIVGGSGTGKTTIAKELFPEEMDDKKLFSYGNNAVIDEMPTQAKMEDITKTFTSVGFGSVPSWLKPYQVLSNGEKMRVDLAKAILSDNNLIVFDEFTSVVDRDVAKTTSFAISKAIRKQETKKFIAISCHHDIKEWLEPDWIYDTDQHRFFFIRRQDALEDPQSTYQLSNYLQRLVERYGKGLASTII